LTHLGRPSPAAAAAAALARGLAVEEGWIEGAVEEVVGGACGWLGTLGIIDDGVSDSIWEEPPGGDADATAGAGGRCVGAGGGSGALCESKRLVIESQ
jgi:hypothetical protein